MSNAERKSIRIGNRFYYINTNEIPGELSHKNTISPLMKITCYLRMRKDHDWYGYMINCTFCSKNVFHWYLIGVYIINLFTLEILFNTMKTNFVFLCTM